MTQSIPWFIPSTVLRSVNREEADDTIGGF